MKNSKLKLLIDAGPLVNGSKSGVGYYTYGLIEALARHYPDRLDMVGHYFNFLKRRHPVLPQHHNLRFRTSYMIPGKAQAIMRRFGLQLPFELLIKERGDIALFPNFVSLPMLNKTKKVIVIHDVGFMDHPEFLRGPNLNFLKRFAPDSINSADLVVAVSQFTKDRLIHHFKVPEKKIVVTPIPPLPITKQGSMKSPAGLPEKFILFLSTLEPRKNFINLVKAYALLPAEIKNNYGLVLAGGRGWDIDKDMALIKSMQAKGENIVVTGYVEDSMKLLLFEKASLFVMPSHYEGFGMPILEAMMYGVPTAVSDIEVFHEAAADASLYFDKDSPDDIARTITELLASAAKRRQLINRGSKRAKFFSWDDNASRLMESFERLIADA